MELSILLFLAVLTGLLFLLFRGHPKGHGHLPPGPRPLPFLGNLLQMDRKGLLKSFLKFQEKYGDVFTVYLGPRPVVMLCGPEAIREALVDQAEAFSGRAPIAAVDSVFQGYGVIFANGERWKTLRRFSLATMRDFGMGKRSIEERIQEEAQCMVEELRKSHGGLVDPIFLFHSVTANIICSIIFGKRFDYKDPQFLRLLDLFYKSFSLISSFSSQVFQLFSNILKHFPGTHREIYKNLQEISTFIGHSVEKHRETLDPSSPRDFIDTFLIRMDKDKSHQHTEFHHKNLILTSHSLFFAGTETTSTTLRYGFLCLLKYPHITERVQKEIEQVIGSHRQPALEDRTKMPYTEAVICEMQRFADLVPIGVPHVVTKDTSFRGFILPKNTEIYPVLSTALHDPRYFEKPDTFNPDHFLDAKGELRKNVAFIPFSVDKKKKDQAQEVSVGVKDCVGCWTPDHWCFGLADSLSAFCFRPETLTETGIKHGGLTNLSKVLSRHLNIDAVPWVSLRPLSQIYVVNQEQTSQQDDLKCEFAEKVSANEAVECKDRAEMISITKKEQLKDGLGSS